MKSRDEIVIIMLQWMRLYTLGSRGSRELKTFLETRLISSRVDKNLRTKKGEYMLLKREIGPKIVGHWSSRGGDLQGSWERFHLARTRLQFRADFDRISRSKSLQFLSRSHHDRATIVPRSGHDRASIVILELRRSSSARVESIPWQKGCDRGSIAKFFHDVFAPSDGDPQIVIANNRGRLMHLKPFDSMPIGRSSGCHVVRGKSSDPRHLLFLLRTWWI